MTAALLVDLALALLLVGAAVWAQRLVADLRTLPPADAPTGGTIPVSVSVVVPARDEEQTLPALLRSVAEQLPEVREVVVVDDASRDATAAVARAGGARVVPAGTATPRVDRQGLGLPHRRRGDDGRPRCSSSTPTPSSDRVPSQACSPRTPGTAGSCRCSRTTTSYAPTSSCRPTSTWSR